MSALTPREVQRPTKRRNEQRTVSQGFVAFGLNMAGFN